MSQNVLFDAGTIFILTVGEASFSVFFFFSTRFSASVECAATRVLFACVMYVKPRRPPREKEISCDKYRRGENDSLCLQRAD